MKRRSAESVDEFRRSLDIANIENRLQSGFEVNKIRPKSDDYSAGLHLDDELVKNSVLQLAYWGETNFSPPKRRKSFLKRQKKSTCSNPPSSVFERYNLCEMGVGHRSNPLLPATRTSTRSFQQFPSILAMMNDDKPVTSQQRRKSFKLRSPLIKKNGNFNVHLASSKSEATKTFQTRKKQSPTHSKKRKSFGWTKKKQKSN
ncbi:uncharacterized protein LOC134195071 [Corticium candelabrum]|uniref:uncharacterized protein LOC134195071 n=1 Tax=Corticium candelabrum TaxID=121492 RepID=UPI002E2685F6|nr:uncharacterized protein LOC134195071 [Corticium candelabrum]